MKEKPYSEVNESDSLEKLRDDMKRNNIDPVPMEINAWIDRLTALIEKECMMEEKPHIDIIFYTKEGREYSHRIEFETELAYDLWEFNKYVKDRMQYENGMFLTDQAEFISIDIIARIKYEPYDGPLF